MKTNETITEYGSDFETVKTWVNKDIDVVERISITAFRANRFPETGTVHISQQISEYVNKGYIIDDGEVKFNTEHEDYSVKDLFLGFNELDYIITALTAVRDLVKRHN